MLAGTVQTVNGRPMHRLIRGVFIVTLLGCKSTMALEEDLCNCHVQMRVVCVEGECPADLAAKLKLEMQKTWGEVGLTSTIVIEPSAGLPSGILIVTGEAREDSRLHVKLGGQCGCVEVEAGNSGPEVARAVGEIFKQVLVTAGGEKDVGVVVSKEDRLEATWAIAEPSGMFVGVPTGELFDFYDQNLTSTEGASLGVMFKNAGEICVLAVPAIRIMGGPAASGLEKASLGWRYRAFIPGAYLPGASEHKPNFAAHEIGHILLNMGESGHRKTKDNLMYNPPEERSIEVDCRHRRRIRSRVDYRDEHGEVVIRGIGATSTDTKVRTPAVVRPSVEGVVDGELPWRGLAEVEAESREEHLRAKGFDPKRLAQWLLECEESCLLSTDPEIYARVHLAIRLARFVPSLRGSSALADKLGGVVLSEGAFSLRFEAAQSLAEIYPNELRSLLGDLDGGQVAAVLVALDPMMDWVWSEDLRRFQGEREDVSLAVELLEFSKREYSLYEGLEGGEIAKMRYIERKLRGYWNPLLSELEAGNPLTGGSPDARWALKEWLKIRAEVAERISTEFYAGLEADFGSAEIEQRYRTWLAMGG